MDKELNVMNIIKTIDAFSLKKGRSVELRNKLISDINTFMGDEQLKLIYVNNTANDMLPDVFIMPIYDEEFNKLMNNGDIKNQNISGYSIEFHERVFTKYTAEELTAIIVHDALQNVYSSISKSRLIGAYSKAIEERYDAILIDNLFDEEENYSEMLYMMYLDICMRPFRIPVYQDSIVGTDSVLYTYKLSDSYNSALEKIIKLQSKDITVDKLIDDETKSDLATARTIIKACITDDMHHYYDILKKKLPLLTISSTTDAKLNTFILALKNHKVKKGINKIDAINESFSNPSNESELRFQIDKILVSSRYMETEDERNQLLYKIVQLTKKLNSTLADLSNKQTKNPSDGNIKFKINYVVKYLDELDAIRLKIVNMDVKPKKYGVFIEYPEGYDY